MRVIDLIEILELRSYCIAGAQGLDRAVLWAHVCELKNPTEWLGDGDLIMTTGLAIPSEPDEQRKYIKLLSNADIAGLMIGENMHAPEDIGPLLEVAESCGFPILMTHYSIPFASVTKAVIDANRKAEFDRRNSIARIHVSARLAIEGLSIDALLNRLAKDTQSELALIDVKAKFHFFTDEFFLPRELTAELCKFYSGSTDNQPAVCRHSFHNDEYLSVALPARSYCFLVAKRKYGSSIDYGVLYHLVAVLGIAYERLYFENERSLRLGAELLDNLLNQRLSRLQVERQLSFYGLKLRTVRVAVIRTEKQDLADWGMKCSWESISVLFRAQGKEVITLINDKDTCKFQHIVKYNIGLSALIKEESRFLEALKEARLALTHTTMTHRVVVYENISDKLPWVAQNIEQAEMIFKRVLGEVHEYDKTHKAALLKTLQVFLAQNRSWKNAAELLHIHRTTLRYRIERIEEISNRTLNNTEDVAVLWLALQAADVIGLDLY